MRASLLHFMDPTSLFAPVANLLVTSGFGARTGWIVAAVGALALGWTAIRAMRPRAERVLILGAGPMAARVIEAIEELGQLRHAVAGVVDDRRPEPAEPFGRLWLGSCDRFAEIVREIQPTRIVLALVDRRDHLPLQALLESRVDGVAVDDALEFCERLTGKLAIEALRPSMLIHSSGFRNHGGEDAVARVFSIAASVLGLILAAPLMAVIALAIKLDSKGPVLYIHDRAGRGGRAFGLVKFRTMRPCTTRRSEWVSDNTDRITSVGRWLRRYRLDELPQLVNVLRGDMNLIGPRPHPVSNHSIFMEHIAYYGLRSTVRPGVTGWAQVCYGYANNLKEETEKMRYDLYYIKNRTVWLDLRILARTLTIVLTGTGSAAIHERVVRSRAVRGNPGWWFPGTTIRKSAARQ